MNHQELVKRGVNWLKNNQVSGMRSVIVLPEYKCYADSIPDVIGMNHDMTIVIECKVSRADYFQDQHKKHRQHTFQLGNMRYYLCPDNLIFPDEVYHGWGLLYCGEYGITIVKESDIFPKEITRQQEYQVMYSIIRRLMSADGHDKTLELLKGR